MAKLIVDKTGSYNCNGNCKCGGSNFVDEENVKRSFNCVYCNSFKREGLKIIDNRGLNTGGEFQNKIPNESIPVLKTHDNSQNEIKQAEEKAEQEFNKILDKIETEKTDIIDEYYSTIKHYAKMVALGHRKGLILFGEGGLGKSHNVIQAFKEADKPFVHMSGHITNLELYQFLYTHKTENIILDDVNVLDNEINLNMLKSALNDKMPIVCYSTSSARLKVPNKFLFEGSIIIILNKKPRNNHSLMAVESRVLTYNLRLEYLDKLKIMKQITQMDYDGLTKEQKDEIFDWIQKNTNQATENFNLRTLFHIFEMYKYNKDEWKALANKIIVNNEELSMIISGISSEDWCRITNKTRSTYFRYKKMLGMSKDYLKR